MSGQARNSSQTQLSVLRSNLGMVMWTKLLMGPARKCTGKVKSGNAHVDKAAESSSVVSVQMRSNLEMLMLAKLPSPAHESVQRM